MTLHQGVVDLVDAAVAELLLQVSVCAVRRGDHHQATGADIEAMDYPLPLGGSAARQGETGGRQPAGDGGPGPPWARVGSDPHRFVHHDHIRVLVDDSCRAPVSEQPVRLGPVVPPSATHRAAACPSGLPGCRQRRPFLIDQSRGGGRDRPSSRERVTSRRSPASPSGIGR